MELAEFKKAHQAHIRACCRLEKKIRRPRGVPEMREAMAAMVREGERWDKTVQQFRRDRRKPDL